MSERAEQILKRLCLVLAIVLVYPVVRLWTRDDGLKALPSIQLSDLSQPIEGRGTNQPKNAASPLPEPIRLQVDKITQSEILGPVVRPQPVALMGIAGRDAFIRSLNGRTGLLREGETLDGIKLIQVGTNRVLIEEDGKQRELTIFSGLGGPTLLPKPQEKKP